jgi:predicted transcriptional regulator
MAASEKTNTIPMDARTLKRIDRLASAMSRSRAWVVKQAMRRYLDDEEWFVREVQKGLKEADAGDVVDHEVVVRKWERKREASVDARRHS